MPTITPWEEMTRRDQLAATHYDFYKDVHGIRPRWMNYDEMTEQELEQELDQLSREAERVFAEEREQQARAAHDFETRVQMLLGAGARDREQALRWIHEAEGSDGDPEYLCYLLGLRYGYFQMPVDNSGR